MNKKWEKEKLAKQLHGWYLEAVNELDPENYNPKAQRPYNDLKEEQKQIDRHIAEKVIEELAEQRTQLLARVREAVGEKENIEGLELTMFGKARNALRQELLKKLEIISEEGR